MRKNIKYLVDILISIAITRVHRGNKIKNNKFSSLYIHNEFKRKTISF